MMDEDAIIDAQLEYLRAGGKANPRRRKLEKKLANLIPKLDKAESDLRRAFNRWESFRKAVKSTERNLDAIAREENDNV